METDEYGGMLKVRQNIDIYYIQRGNSNLHYCLGGRIDAWI